ncbi:hypothetical protein Q1695_004261 [Nippostrongylus brasiliensis]|nr:hypothetical protein Q1695_004261 [Nippostrongylus brasiliensis]
MRLGLILSLVSSFQIFQQSVVNELHDVDRSSLSFSLASASFPLGQFISTLFLAVHSISAEQGLIADAWLLIVGSVVAAVPSWLFLCVGRFLIGCGAGLGFVCSTIVLYDRIPFGARPAHFLALGLSFAFATLMINITPLVYLSDTFILNFASVISAASGIAYLLLRPRSGEHDLEDSVKVDFADEPSKFPSTLVYVLMVLNVSIGVPAILAFSKTAFENFGIDPATSSALSVAFPLIQMLLIFVLYKLPLNRKILIVGGYIVATMIQGSLLLTSFYQYLPEEHKTVALSVLFWLLAVVVSVPCNTALCLITEQFASSKEQMTFASRGRALMWVLATVSTATFTLTMEAYGFTVCFLPYVVISTVMLAVLILIYPQQAIEVLE